MNDTIISYAKNAAKLLGFSDDEAELQAFATWCYTSVPMLSIQDAWPAWRSARNWIHPDERA